LPELRVDRPSALRPSLRFEELQVTVDSIKEEMPELPWDKEARFVDEYGINEASIRILTDTKELAEHFEEAVKLGKEKSIDPKQVANYIINQKVDMGETSPAQVMELVLSKRSYRSVGWVGWGVGPHSISPSQ